MKIKSSCKLRTIAGEPIIMSQGENGVDMTRVIALNESGVFLFRKLLELDHFTLQEASHLLINEYHIDESIALKDASRWIEKLIKGSVIEK